MRQKGPLLSGHSQLSKSLICQGLASLKRVCQNSHMKNAPFQRRSRTSGRHPPPGPLDAAADLVRHARTLHGEDGDPWQVTAELFKASFFALARLAPEDDRRHGLLQRA